MASEIDQMSEKIFDGTTTFAPIQKAKAVQVDQRALERESKKIEKHQEKIIKETEEEIREKKRQGMVRRYMARLNHPEIGPSMKQNGFVTLSPNCTFEQAELVLAQMDDYDKREGKEAMGRMLYKGLNQLTEKFFVQYLQKQSMDHFAEFAENNLDFLQPNFSKVCLDIPDWMIGGPFVQLMMGYWMMIDMYQKGVPEAPESKEKEEADSPDSPPGYTSQWNSSSSTTGRRGN